MAGKIRSGTTIFDVGAALIGNSLYKPLTWLKRIFNAVTENFSTLK